MAYYDGYISVGDRLDAKCGKGWEGVKGKCERSKSPNELPKNKPEVVKKALKYLVLAAQVAYGVRIVKGAYRIGQRSLAEKNVTPLPKEDLSTISTEEVERLEDVKELGTGMYGTATLSKDVLTGQKYVVKKQSKVHQGQEDLFAKVHNAAYIYTSSVEATTSDIAQGSGIPAPKVSVFPYRNGMPAVGVPPRMGGSVQEVAKGETIDKILSGEEGKRLYEFSEYKGGNFPLPVSPEAEVIIGGMKGIQNPAFKGITKENLEAMKHPDLAKIMAFDTFTGNTDRHGGNFFYDSKSGGFSAIDNGMAFLDSKYAKSIARGLKNEDRYRKMITEDPSLKAGFIEYKKTLEDLIMKNPPEKTKSRLLGYMQVESNPKGFTALVDFFARAERILQVESNYKEANKIVSSLEKILQ